MAKRATIRDMDKGVSPLAAKKSADFLFDLIPDPEDDDAEAMAVAKLLQLSAKTRVKGAQTMAALAYYDILYAAFGCEAAGKISMALKALLIGDEGEGRKEAVAMAQGKQPKEIEIPVGYIP